ncbi:MAG TPA: excisionase [Azospirillum sp.]|nr:excisionase [Azospirillum sp.]
MPEKLLTLEEWARTVYGDHPPAVVTLRRWAREARIYPAPEKHGRTYFVPGNARYLDPSKPIPTPANTPARNIRSPLVERIRGKTA